MFRAALRSLGQHRVRLLLTLLAVVVGVAFVAGTFIFTDSLKQSFDALFSAPQSDVTISADSQFASGGQGGGPGSGADQTPTIPVSLLPQVSAVDGVAGAYGMVTATGAIVLDKDGKPVGRAGPPDRAVSWLPDASINALSVSSGQAPQGSNQVALLESTATSAGVGVGDTVTIETSGGQQSYTVTGLVTRGIGGSDGGTLTVFDLPTAQRQMLGNTTTFTSIAVKAMPGVSQTELANRLSKALPGKLKVETGAQRSADIANRLQTAFGFINTFLLAFALIALFVAIFLIFNTFSMLVAQRTRELALLRAVGASRGQVRQSVLAEAAVLGLIAAAIGVLGGIAVSQGLRLLLKVFGADLPAAPLVIQPRTIIVSLLLGIGVTLISAYVPARRAASVPPVAAMRDDVSMPAKNLRIRGIIGTVLIVIAALAAYSATRNVNDNMLATRLVGLSAICALIGVIALAPILGRWFIGVCGLPLRGNAIGNLAVENGRRNPRRTAATASALAIGLALMSAIGVLAASTKASVAAVVDDTIGADFIVLGANFQPFRPEVFAAVKDTPGTSTVTYTRQIPLAVGDDQGVLTGIQSGKFQQVFNLTMDSGTADNLLPGDAIVDSDTAKRLGISLGQNVPVDYVSGPGFLILRGTYKPAGPITGWISDVQTLTDAGGRDLDSAIYVRSAEGSDPTTVKASLDKELAAFPAVKLQDQASLKDQINQQFDRVFGFIYALLALAVIVAFLGIVNTLALSVFERRREVGLLRAVGTSRAQIRRMVVIESVLIALFGALIGLSLGLIYGTLFRKVLESVGISKLAIPTGQIVWFVVLAVVGGIIAALWPAFTASRLDVLKAIASN